MKIEEITLLSVEEYKKYRDTIKPIDGWWWLRSPGRVSTLAACVIPDDFLYEEGELVDDFRLCVRPALVIKDAPSVGRSFTFGEVSGTVVSWTVISDTLALADEPFCKMAFRKAFKRPDANEYEKSDIKPYLDCWLTGLEEEA